MGRTKGGLNFKLRVICDGDGGPLARLLSEGQVSDHTGAKLLYPKLQPTDKLNAEKGYASDESREAFAARNIEACIPPTSNQKLQHAFDRQFYRARHKIQNKFHRLKGWRCISTRHHRCVGNFCPAICFAAAFIFYLNQSTLGLKNLETMTVSTASPSLWPVLVYRVQVGSAIAQLDLKGTDGARPGVTGSWSNTGGSMPQINSMLIYIASEVDIQNANHEDDHERSNA